MSNTGDSNFIVRLIDKNGETAELLANEIGDFSGTQAVGVDTTGYFYLAVTGQHWGIDVQ